MADKLVTTVNSETFKKLVDMGNDTYVELIEPLGCPVVARQLAASTTSNSVTLTTTCRRISIRARNCDMRYVVGVGAQTANSSTSHFIAQDERLDIAVPIGTTIAVIREAGAVVDGSLAISELT